MYLIIKDQQIKWYRKLPLFLPVAYFLSPIDLIPDFIPGLGMLDDAIILPILVYLAMIFVNKEQYEQKLQYATEHYNDKMETKWTYSLLIILLWGLLIGLLIYWLMVK
ncbi:MAG: YkvA family protein [Erysipelotrichaceae bacterium]